DGAAKPFLTSIGERAEQLAQAYEDRQLTTQQVLLDFQNLAQQYVDSDEERKRLGVDENTFAIYTTVKLVAPAVSTEQAAAWNGVKPVQIHLRPMRTKWGSVSRKGRLTLDTQLLAIPQDLAEYVIVHELLHFLAPNHGKLFKSFLFAYMPDWEDRHQRLQQYER